LSRENRLTEHRAQVSWRRNGVEFVDHRYTRGHEWYFDGGARIEASASPSNVPGPWSVPEAVDPEEALVAATSSCHMLWLLALAARRGFVVDEYTDEATGVIEGDAAGRRAFSRITLRPRVLFSGNGPSEAELSELHEEAHNNCFIANSLRCEVVIARAPDRQEAE
jgi:organic hydroperoxide reductase OsmC/OhrA